MHGNTEDRTQTRTPAACHRCAVRRPLRQRLSRRSPPRRRYSRPHRLLRPHTYSLNINPYIASAAQSGPDAAGLAHIITEKKQNKTRSYGQLQSFFDCCVCLSRFYLLCLLRPLALVDQPCVVLGDAEAMSSENTPELCNVFSYL